MIGRGALPIERNEPRIAPAPAGASSPAGVFVLFAALLLAGCAGTGAGSKIAVSEIQSLSDIEALLPMAPDSIVGRYRDYDSTAFRTVYRDELELVTTLIDSLNTALGPLPDSLRIDTLAIDHSFGGFGVAARQGKAIVMSAGYFIAFDNADVLRSVVFHEFGHIAYILLDATQKATVDTLRRGLEESALLYLFHDGEYSGNARFGGHPGDNPTELYASAFNLIHNRAAEMRARLAYVEPRHYPLVRMLSILTGNKETAVVGVEP